MMASETLPSSKKSNSTNLMHAGKEGFKTLQAFIQKFNHDWSTTFAGTLAYTLLMSMLPLALALFGTLGLILGKDNALQNQIAQQLATAVPATANTSASATKETINLALTQLRSEAGFLLLIAIILAVFAGSRLFIALENTLDIVYRIRPRPLIRQNLVAFGMLLLFMVLVPIMIAASSAPTIILAALNNHPTLQSIPFFSAVASNPFVTYLAAIAGTFLVGFIMFEAIYFVVPNQRISWRNSWRGAVVAAIALTLFLVLFPIYIQYGMSKYSGQIGFAVILLVFFYYFAVILLLGAEVNAFFLEGVRPLPNELATFVSTMAGKLNQDIPEAESEYHVDTASTDRADRSHIARERMREEPIQRENMQEQKQLAAKALAKSKAEKRKAQRSSRLYTMLEVLAGSLAAFLFAWLRLRRGK
jgi:YihY family inner membrane protein